MPNIKDCWHQKEETHSKYANLSNLAGDIFSIILHGVGVEASFSFLQDAISWSQSTTTGKTLHEEMTLRKFARANTGLLAADDPALDRINTDNGLEMQREEEQNKMHRMAKVCDILEMWQGSQNIHTTQSSHSK